MKIKTNKKGFVEFDKWGLSSFSHKGSFGDGVSYQVDFIRGNLEPQMRNQPKIEKKPKKTSGYKPNLSKVKLLRKKTGSFYTTFRFYSGNRTYRHHYTTNEKAKAEMMHEELLERRQDLYSAVKAGKGTIDDRFYEYIKNPSKELLEQLKAKYNKEEEEEEIIRFFGPNKGQKETNLLIRNGRHYSAFSMFGSRKVSTFCFGLVHGVAQEQHEKLIERRDVLYKELKVEYGTHDKLFAKFVRTGDDNILKELKKKYPKDV